MRAFSEQRSFAMSLIAGLLVLGGLIYAVQSVTEGLELSLLDLRLKARADTLTPSSDIIVAAMDRRTRDAGRNYPELGLNRRVLPRRKIAQMIDYFSREGARSIVLDLMFEEPQTPEDDAALALAMRRTGNVYLASSVELPLSEYQAREMAAHPERLGTDTLLAFANARLVPWIGEQARLSSWFPAENTRFTAFYEGGFFPYRDVGVLPGIANPVLPDAVFTQIWQQAAEHTAQVTSTDFSQLGQKDAALLENTENPLMSYYRALCTGPMYTQVFQNSPDFLKALAAQALPLSNGTNVWRTKGSDTYCLTSATLPPILNAAKGLGITGVNYDPDAIIRAVPAFYRAYQNNAYGYLGLMPAFDRVRTSPDIRLESDSFHLPLVDPANPASTIPRRIPRLEDGDIMLNWRSPRKLAEAIYAANHRTLPPEEARQINSELGNRALGYGHLYRMMSAVDLLQASAPIGKNIPLQPVLETPSLYNIYGDADSKRLSLKDKIVIYGDAVEDIHRSPVSSRVFGPEIVATAVDMFLHDRNFVHKAPAAVVWLLSLMIAAGLFFLQSSLNRLRNAVLAGLGIITAFGWGTWELFIYQGLWIPMINPLLLFASALLSGVLFRYAVHDREKRQLTRVFSHYVSPQVMTEIVAHPASVLETMTGVEKNLTVLFADLQGFTERFNRENPQRMVQQLNEFFTAMTAVILQHQGTYDKYIGDCVMAFFGAPTPLADHAALACAAALEMQSTLSALNAQWEAQGLEPLKMGIGLSTGAMIVGNFGSDTLQNYTVMGNAVNLGARLESLTRPLNCPILISDETMRQAGSGIQSRDMGLHLVKGFALDVPVHALERLTAASKS